MTQMTIREKGYHTWDGQLQPSALPWLPMFSNGIKALFKKRFAKIVFFFCAIPFFMFLIGIYLATRPEIRMLEGMFKEIARFLNNEPQFFNLFLTNGTITFLLILLGAFLGAELISGDIRFNAFPLYFARPLDRKDYMLGKFSILMFYFLLFTGGAGILLYIFKIIFTGKLAMGLSTLLGLIFVPLLTSFYIASLVLLLSSISRSTRYVKIFIFIIFFLSKAIAELLVQIFRTPYFYLVSISDIIKQLGAFIFNTPPEYRYPGWLNLVALIALSVGACLFLYQRIGKLEAQIESGN
jgi:ABC-type transport system involved in multi-copper enzyme maturation permease subunit